jgi:SNF2 family DNA or RNA helicase
MKLEIYEPHDYQLTAEDHLHAKRHAGLFLDMGMGKTVVTLTALTNWLKAGKKALIVAPLEVARSTWIQEAKKWSHTSHLRLSPILGTAAQRVRALRDQADIYLINVENFPWLVGHLQGSFPFDVLIVDELSMFKSNKSIRFKAMQKVRHIPKRVIGLTGTPMPNGLPDLWPQMFILDGGQRLGRKIGQFRAKYLVPEKVKNHIVLKYGVAKGDNVLGADIYEKEIYDKISDICISMKARDYLDLPDLIDVVKNVKLPNKVYKQYKEFEREKVMEIADQDITAVNAAVLGGKLMQFANGAIYDEDKNWHAIHDYKLRAMDEVYQAANGQNMLVFFWYRHDYERLIKYFKGERIALIKGPEMIDKWNDGRISLGLAHPRSLGHGVNLQHGGHYCTWFSQLYSSELYSQGMKRVDRQGQLYPVVNTRILIEGTIDEKACRIVDGKKDREEGLLDAVKALVREYKKGSRR